MNYNYRVMNELIGKIEETVAALFLYNMEKYAPLAQELAGMLMNMLPGIIECYSRPGMEDVRGDAAYWPGQLQRIIDALGGGDFFEVTDVLYNETRPNLIELRDMLEKRGVS